MSETTWSDYPADEYLFSEDEGHTAQVFRSPESSRWAILVLHAEESADAFSLGKARVEFLEFDEEGRMISEPGKKSIHSYHMSPDELRFFAEAWVRAGEFFGG